MAKFTNDKISFEPLWYVFQSLESDGYASKGYQFRPPLDIWGINSHLREFEEQKDIKGAAHHTAELLFSPWR